ncbi:hypothetical protein HJFPF1_03467 [Paramyrothecium foliicola]|nr:hypothetical protein HJFPF1_03467 [Paramyrothecium foliicola]
MRFDTTLVQVAMCLASWSSVAAALPDSLPDANGALVARQNDNDNNEQETSSVRQSERSSITAAPASRTSSGSSRQTNSADNEDEDRESQSASGRSRTPTATRTRFPPDSPPGGISMLDPATTLEPTPLYKIRDEVTFNWNYTSLRGTPKAIDVYVSAFDAKATWTLTSNMSFNTNASYIWDTKEQATNVENPLPIALYTLIIKDSESEITDVPDAGYLAPYTGLTFGLYQPAKATPWSEWKCIGCSAAPSLFERPALGLAVTMSLVSVFSFTWFVTGLGFF